MVAYATWYGMLQLYCSSNNACPMMLAGSRGTQTQRRAWWIARRSSPGPGARTTLTWTRLCCRQVSRTTKTRAGRAESHLLQCAATFCNMSWRVVPSWSWNGTETRHLLESVSPSARFKHVRRLSSRPGLQIGIAYSSPAKSSMSSSAPMPSSSRSPPPSANDSTTDCSAQSIT